MVLRIPGSISIPYYLFDRLTEGLSEKDAIRFGDRRFSYGVVADKTAAERNLPIIVPGWEDSTMGNIFASYVIKNELKATTMKSGIEYMVWLADWYRNNSSGKGVGFFQIGGGIAGDFPICVVPMMYQDLEWHDVPFWSYFCQISDSTTSYGSYSGAVPNEKITWGKLDIHTPKFIVESDATIVAPLIFAWILGW